MASTVFIIDGIEPVGDLAWQLADESTRRAFWKAVVAFGLKAKDAELAKGLDRYGRPLKPIARSTRKNRRSAMGPADPSAPPLMPAYGTSRTRLNLTGRAFKDHAEFFWIDGWGRILDIHRHGSRRGLPVRDVIGISPKALGKVAAWALAWWQDFKRSKGLTARVQLPVAPAGRLPVIGRTDFDRFTYGIGTNGGDQAAIDRRLLAEGRTTGFYQKRPGQGSTAYGGPNRPRKR